MEKIAHRAAQGARKLIVEPVVVDRFWSKVDKNGKCWIWSACKNIAGYGKFAYKDQNLDKTQYYYAHRFVYELLIGKVPKGLHIDHLCRVKNCVNPKHLEVVTPRENILRGVGASAINMRKTHCLRGHELSGENIGITKKGWRRCRICDRTKPRAPIHSHSGKKSEYKLSGSLL